MRILVINPGSTSTKIAVYENEQPLLVRSIRHSKEELSVYPKLTDQFVFRKSLVLKALEDENIPFSFDGIIGRGGLVKPISGGVYEVNETMKYDAAHTSRVHASNLGCLIAAELAAALPGCRAFIADPVVVDELEDVARVTGSPLLPRLSIWHALNQRAIARRYAREHGKRYDEVNVIVCHLGGGVSVGTHRQGRAVDVNNGLDGEGPLSPERSGTLPAAQLVELCFSGHYTEEELKLLITGNGGLMAHLRTTDIPAIVSSIEAGDKQAELVLNAMIYQVAKSVGAASVVLSGKVDAILVTGGIAYSDYVTTRLRERISFLAPVFTYPGEDEMEALAGNALSVLRGEVSVQIYQ